MMNKTEVSRRLIRLSAEIINYPYSSKAPTSYLDDWEFEFWPDLKTSRVPAKLRREIIERCRHMETKLKDWGYEISQVVKALNNDAAPPLQHHDED